jgi:hypothetical protein
MSVVREMRAQMQQPKGAGGEGLFYAALVGIIVLGGAGAGYMMLGGKGAPEQVAKASPDVTATASRSIAVAAKPTLPPVAVAGRLGSRERSAAAAACLDAGKMAMGSLMKLSAGSDRSKPRAHTAEETVQMVRAGFQMIDTWFDIHRKTALMGAFMGRPEHRSSGPDTSASLVGDFVECMLATPIHKVCDPDNRAAAVSYVGTYLVRGAAMVAEIDKMEPMKRFKAEEAYNVPQYRTVVRSVEQHLRSGSLVAADFGRSPPAQLGQLIVANPRQNDICSPRS